MARPSRFTVKKLLAISPEMAGAIEDFRFSHRLKTEADAMRRLIEAGLSKAGTSGASDGSGGEGKTAAPPKPPPRAKTNPTRSASPNSPVSKEAQLRALRESRPRA